jgi:hypothetical protein
VERVVTGAQTGISDWKLMVRGVSTGTGTTRPGFAAAFTEVLGWMKGPGAREVSPMKTQYVRLSDEQKLALLQAHSFQVGFESLESRCWCLHCEKEFDGHSVRVWKGGGQLWLECGTPDCDGSPIDWFPYPWWDKKHPATKAHRKRERSQRQGERTSGPGSAAFAA